MFTTGFSDESCWTGRTYGWRNDSLDENVLCWASACPLCGSLIIKEDGRYFNRLLFVEPSGEIRFYNKRHLFSMGNEDRYFEKGMERLVVEYKGWRIARSFVTTCDFRYGHETGTNTIFCVVFRQTGHKPGSRSGIPCCVTAPSKTSRMWWVPIG